MVTRRDPVRTRRESPGVHDRIAVARECLVIKRPGGNGINVVGVVFDNASKSVKFFGMARNDDVR